MENIQAQERVRKVIEPRGVLELLRRNESSLHQIEMRGHRQEEHSRHDAYENHRPSSQLCQFQAVTEKNRIGQDDQHDVIQQLQHPTLLNASIDQISRQL